MTLLRQKWKYWAYFRNEEIKTEIPSLPPKSLYKAVPLKVTAFQNMNIFIEV